MGTLWVRWPYLWDEVMAACREAYDGLPVGHSCSHVPETIWMFLCATMTMV